MQKTTLVIMAAGLGTRFGEGIKQLTPVGPNGEIIIDYSIHDALEAGFNKVVFIIRKDLEADFKEIIGRRVEALCEVEYAFQELDKLPAGFSCPTERKKPWGTGHAIMVCRDLVKEPFLVINADDYYGKEAFVKVHDYLVAHADQPSSYCMAGFLLKNTLSENGGVTRGVCSVDENGYLTDVNETKNIVKADGCAIAESTGKELALDTYVSMNMWGLMPQFLDVLEDGFAGFLQALSPEDVTAEYLLPAVVDGLVKEKKATVQVLETKDSWFGVTYAADRPGVQAAFAKLIADGVYTSPLTA